MKKSHSIGHGQTGETALASDLLYPSSMKIQPCFDRAEPGFHA